ncbi:MAG TPA: hypothetical protein VNN12_05565 [Dehalococcoidia bacterium]|nr:hypothetical protein [Dehalococcoidia bacterium]
MEPRRPAANANHYQLLGVGPLAPQDLIVEAYWLRSRPPGQPIPPEGLLKRLNEAYATLVDPDRRDRYNEALGLPVPSRRRLWEETLRAPHEWLQVDPVTGRDLVPLAYTIMREHWLEAVAAGRAHREALRHIDAARDALLAEPEKAAWTPPPSPNRARRIDLAPALREAVTGLVRGLRALLQGPQLPPPQPEAQNGAAAETRIQTLTPSAVEPPPADEAPVPDFLTRTRAEREADATVEPEPPAPEGAEVPAEPPASRALSGGPRAAQAPHPLVPVKSAPPDAIEGAYLTWAAPGGEQVAVPIEEFLRVGTHNLCEIRLAGEDMPDELVRIWRDPDGRYVLRHMPASGVIAINGEPVIWAELDDGDVIDVCGVPVTFRQAAPVSARNAQS